MISIYVLAHLLCPLYRWTASVTYPYRAAYTSVYGNTFPSSSRVEVLCVAGGLDYAFLQGSHLDIVISDVVLFVRRRLRGSSRAPTNLTLDDAFLNLSGLLHPKV